MRRASMPRGVEFCKSSMLLAAIQADADYHADRFQLLEGFTIEASRDRHSCGLGRRWARTRSAVRAANASAIGPGSGVAIARACTGLTAI
jgi:hypothetical protein